MAKESHKQFAKKPAAGRIDPSRRRKGGIILIVILALMLWGVLMLYSLVTSHVLSDMSGIETPKESAEDGKTELSETQSKLLGIRASVSELAMQFDEAYKNYYTQCQTKVRLSAQANYERVAGEGDAAIVRSGRGGIVKIENGEATLPRGLRSRISEYAGKFTQDSGTLIYDTRTREGTIRKDVLGYCHIRGPYYYVEIFDGDQLLDYIDHYVNYDEILESMEIAHDVQLYLVCPDRENSKYFFNLNGNLVYFPDKIPGTRIDFNTEDLGLPSDFQSLMDYDATIVYDQSREGVPMVYRVYEIEVLDCLLIIATPYMNVALQILRETMFGLTVILILSLVFIVWITSVYKEMQRGVMTEEKRNSYSPARVRLIAVSCGFLGALAVFVSCLFIRSLSSIYTESENMKTNLAVMQWQINRNKDYNKQKSEQRRQLYMDYAFRTAELLEDNPGLRSKEELSELNRIMGTEYIMLFDSHGVETATSSDYVNVVLGGTNPDKPTSTADFLRILNGVAGISHSAYTDEVTGRKLELHGARMQDPASKDYSVLLLAVKPEDINEEKKKDEENRILMTLTPTSSYSFCFNSKTRECESISSNDLPDGVAPEDLNADESIFRDNLLDFIRLNGRKYLMVSSKAEDEIRYYYMCTLTSQVYGNALRYSFYYALGFALIFAILCLYLLRGYNIDAMEKMGSGETSETGPEEKPRGRLATLLYHIVGNASPERKALLIFQTLIAIALLFVVIRASIDVGQNSGSVLSYIMEGKWNKGFNLFSITSIVFLLCGIELIMIFIGFVLKTVGRMLNSRGQTICRLIKNLTNYISIMIFFYYALSYLGVDTNAILASVGVIGIGVSMGARDLIADIFAGVSTIFEGEYQVGDIVNIDGYRGMVQEIGVRSTRLIGRGGNIKVIGNKDIHSVTNLTKLNSWVPITIKVDVTYPLKDAEAAIYEAIPRIAETCPQIISGPYYKGVLSVENGFAVLSIIAECNEDDYHKVERALVRDILLALREKNIPVR